MKDTATPQLQDLFCLQLSNVVPKLSVSYLLVFSRQEVFKMQLNCYSQTQNNPCHPLVKTREERNAWCLGVCVNHLIFISPETRYFYSLQRFSPQIPLSSCSSWDQKNLRFISPCVIVSTFSSQLPRTFLFKNCFLSITKYSVKHLSRTCLKWYCHYLNRERERRNLNLDLHLQHIYKI